MNHSSFQDVLSFTPTEPCMYSIDWTWRESEMDKAAMEAKVSQFKARGEHDPPIKSFIGWKGLVRETVTFT